MATINQLKLTRVIAMRRFLHVATTVVMFSFAAAGLVILIMMPKL
ncbi:MAG: hypothetical protein Q7T86_11110 [Hyphomicrobiaceae bacterium]|jgi:hypothetical protein|nr:hypothetical protein [Hyphomicrobiaceae bacterium]